jgi:hypothetical protein
MKIPHIKPDIHGILTGTVHYAAPKVTISPREKEDYLYPRRMRP